MKTAAVLVLVWLASVSAQLQQSGPCPLVPFVRKFNLSKMMGQWYEQIHTQRWSDLELDCNSHLFTFISNTSFTYDTFARNPTRANQYNKHGTVQLKKTEKGYALDVSEGGDSYDVIVIDTDYTTFATLWTCMPGESSHFENVVVLTRQKFPGLSALLSALDALDAKNITRMYLVYTEQRNCPKFTPAPPGAPTSPLPPVGIVTTPRTDSTTQESDTKAPELPSSTTVTVNITVIPPIDINPTAPIIILPPLNVPNSPTTTPSIQQKYTESPITSPGTGGTNSGSNVPTEDTNVTPPSSGGTTPGTGVWYVPILPSVPNISTLLPSIPGVSSVTPGYKGSDIGSSGTTMPGQISTNAPSETTSAPHAGESTTAPHAGGSTIAPQTGGSTTAPQAGGSTTAPQAGGSTTAPQTGGSTTAPPAVKASAAKNSLTVTSIFASLFTAIFIFKTLLFI